LRNKKAPINLNCRNIIAARFVEDPEPTWANSECVEFASENWHIREKYQGLRNPVGSSVHLIGKAFFR
jgi:hypothetical protein